MHHPLLFAISLHVSPKSGPIDRPLQELLNLAVATGLLLAGIGFVTGAGLAAVGRHSGNYELARRGHSAMVTAAFCAALIAGATAIINYFWKLGLMI